MYSKLRYSGFNMENRCYRELMNAPLWNLSSFSVMWNLKSSNLVCRPRSWPFQISLMLCHIPGRWDLLSNHYLLDSILRFLCISLLLQLERTNALGFHLLFCIANFSWAHNLNPYLHAFRRDHTTNFHGTSQDSRSLPTDKAWSNSPLCSSKPCEHLPNPLMPPLPGPSSINFCYLEEPGIEVCWQLIWVNLSETRGQLGCIPHQSHLGI